MKELTIGVTKFTSNIYDNYRRGCNLELEMKGGYYGEDIYDDFKGDEIDSIIKFLQQHQRDVEDIKDD